VSEEYEGKERKTGYAPNGSKIRSSIRPSSILFNVKFASSGIEVGGIYAYKYGFKSTRGNGIVCLRFSGSTERFCAVKTIQRL
jgi:hypothetical protein